MRRLYFIPIIHLTADMGSLGPALDEKARAELGTGLWHKHQETISAFWDSIARFFDTVNAAGLKIYQDGLVADGADGIKIVREGVSQGSKNYDIIGRLLERGALLVRTEELALVKQEYTYVTRLARSPSLSRTEERAARTARSQLLARRDDFIAQRIRETLAENETGALFIGAYHDVLPRLPRDIRVIQVKDLTKVREYYRTLAGSDVRRPGPRYYQLAVYLASAVAAAT